MKIIVTSLLYAFLVAETPMASSETSSLKLNSYCYEEEDNEVCKQYLASIDVDSLTNSADLFRFSQAYEKAFSDEGRPELAFEIVKNLAEEYPNNEEYFPYLVFLHKNYSNLIGDDDWWNAFSYALQLTREQPNNQFGYFWSSVLLEELESENGMLDSIFRFSVRNFEAAARSADPFVNKLYTANTVRKRFIRHKKFKEAELFSHHALEQLKVREWASDLFREFLGYESIVEMATFIRHLCNGSLVALDGGEQCRNAAVMVSGHISAAEITDKKMIEAIAFASSNAQRYAPELEDLRIAIFELEKKIQ